MFVRDHLGRGVARSRRDVGRSEGFAHLEACPVGSPALDGRTDRVLGVLGPARPSGEACLTDPLGLSDEVGERLELVLARHLHDEPPVAGAERAHEHLGCRFALAEGPEVRDDVTHRQHRIEHRDVDELSLAGAIALAQCRLHADHREQRRGDVAERPCGDHPRRFVADPGVVVQTGHRLGHHRVGGPRSVGRLPEVAEAGHRQVDEFGPALREHLVAESEPVHRARLEVLADHVEASGQLDEQLAAPRVLQVDSDRCLVEVVAQEGRAHRATLGVGDRGFGTAP